MGIIICDAYKIKAKAVCVMPLDQDEMDKVEQLIEEAIYRSHIDEDEHLQ